MADARQEKLLASLERARNWAIDEALPYWALYGFDRWLGAFHERVDLDGHPMSLAQRRTMSQARQIYVFSHAELLGWHPSAGALAVKAADSLIRRHWRADGKEGWVFSIAPDGGVADLRRDAYAHAFAAYVAGLGLPRPAPSNRFRDVADQDVSRHGYAAGRAGVRRRAGWRSASGQLAAQNPHMHLFEACLAWYEATGEARYLGRAGEIFGLFSTRFLQPSGISANITTTAGCRWKASAVVSASRVITSNGSGCCASFPRHRA